jgi:hypothetical protein
MTGPEGRRPGWTRAIEIALRTSHLGAMAILVGGVHLAAGDPALPAWRALTGVTGLGLLATEVRHSRHWVYQGRGLVTLLHVAALGLLLVPGAGARLATALALVLGAVGSHLPKSVRKWSLRHRRIVD